MIAYRCYFLGEDDKIKGFEIIECASDAAALEEAERRLATCGYPAIEVWDRGRSMKAMRTWLDGRKSHPISFRYSFESHQILFHVQFETAVEATEFEEAFKNKAAA